MMEKNIYESDMLKIKCEEAKQITKFFRANGIRVGTLKPTTNGRIKNPENFENFIVVEKTDPILYLYHSEEFTDKIEKLMKGRYPRDRWCWDGNNESCFMLIVDPFKPVKYYTRRKSVWVY